MAETGHSKEGQRAMMRDCPALKLSVFEDLRVTSKRCGQARLGQKVTHSLVRLNLELKLCTPGQVNSLHLRKAKKARVKAAHIMEKSLGPSQLRRMGRMANKTAGVTGCLRIRGEPW